MLPLPSHSGRSESPSTQAEEARQRILCAALRAFTEKGYAGASTLRIASLAKVSKRDLYAMFPTKEALLVASITDRCHRMPMPQGLPEPRNRQMLASSLEVLATNFLVKFLDPDVIGMHRLAMAGAIRSPKVAQMLEAARDADRAILHQLLASAQTAGLLPAGETARMVRRYLALASDDLVLTLLLGGSAAPSRMQIQQGVARAAADFLQLYPQPRGRPAHVLP